LLLINKIFIINLLFAFVKLNKTERLILFSLGEFYSQLNQPLEKPLKLRTSKVVFITFILHSQIITTQERALYKNLESLEDKKLISYEGRMIHLTARGLEILTKIKDEIGRFVEIKKFFTSKRKLKKEFQTVIS
tara:strand:+ start:18725 stop:19126 length:402 start_codon:yes stop_codon:yes gene_type:complete